MRSRQPKLRRIPSPLVSPWTLTVVTVALAIPLTWDGNFYAAGALAIASVSWFYILFRGPGKHTLHPDIPTVALLHPFGSERRTFLLLNWVSAALWQFGQPILPLDPKSALAADLRAPSASAVRRHRTVFIRVLDPEHWQFEVPDVIEEAQLIVIETSVFSLNLITEFAALTARGKVNSTISIHERGSNREREQYLVFGDPIKAIVESSIEYAMDTPEDLKSLWREIVKRATVTIDLPPGVVRYPEPPLSIFGSRGMAEALKRFRH
jgi:hypothetical protein